MKVLSAHNLINELSIGKADRTIHKRIKAMPKRKNRKNQWEKEKVTRRSKNSIGVKLPLKFKDMVQVNSKDEDSTSKASNDSQTNPTMSSVACQVDLIGMANEGVSNETASMNPGNAPKVQLKTEENPPMQVTSSLIPNLIGEELDSVLYHEVFGVLAPFQIPKEEYVNVGKEEIRSSSKRKGKKGTVEHGCMECGKCFSRREHLLSHVATHNRNPPYRCEPCGKVFSRREHWSNHLAWHSRPHQCTGCGKGFGRREHLSRHQAAGCSANQNGQKLGVGPMACHLCGKSFTRREHYVNHVRWHSGESPHVCAICHKAFTRKEHLRNHVRQHTGESPHQCKYCGRTFSRREHLVNHTRQHTGETPFRCEICPKAFARKDHLLNHTRLHSRDHFMALEPQVTLQQPPV